MATTDRRAAGILASLRDQRLDVHLRGVTREEFDRRIAKAEALGIDVPADIKAPIALAPEA